MHFKLKQYLNFNHPPHWMIMATPPDKPPAQPAVKRQSAEWFGSDDKNDFMYRSWSQVK